MEDIDVKIVEKDGFDVLGYELRTTTKDDKNLLDIPEFWYKLMDEDKMDEIPNRADPDIYFGICADCGPEGSFSYIVAQEVDMISKIPDGMRALALKDSKYAIFPTKDKTPEIINKTFDYIFEEWLPNSKYNRDFGEDFELYTRKNKSMSKSVKIHIPVIEKSRNGK